MSIRIEIDTTGVDELARNAKDPKLVQDGIKFTMFAARRTGKKTMTQLISGGTGLAERSIFAKFSARLGVLTIGTRIVGWRARSMELGRLPGDWVPFRVLQRWMAGAGLRADGASVARMKVLIHAEGAEGKHYLGGTLKVIIDKLPEWNRKALLRMTKRLTKKGVI